MWGGGGGGGGGGTVKPVLATSATTSEPLKLCRHHHIDACMHDCVYRELF